MWNVTRSLSSLRVRYAETDQMGVAYHTHYLVWCEVGRTDFIRQYGKTYADIERDEGIVLAVADAQIRYSASARYDDLVTVETWVERAQSRIVTFAYEIYRDEPGPRLLLATATTRLIALDRDSSPRQLPPDLLKRFKDAQTTP